MSQDLSREEFELIRKIVREKKEEEHAKVNAGTAQGNRVRKTKKNMRRLQEMGVHNVPPPPNVEVVVLDSSSESETNEMATDDSESDIDSDEFEDVPMDSASDGECEDDLNITLDAPAVKAKAEQQKKEREKKKKQIQRNVVSHEVKQFRRYFHMAMLLCLLIHVHIRNQWLNDEKLLNKLYKKHIITDKIEKLLHPTLDKEMPLRSTRKLLDGLKQTMQLWIKHCQIIKSYRKFGLYMAQWDEIKLDSRDNLDHILTKSQFIKNVVKGRGDKDILTQGFVALLRAHNVNARLCFSCQPPDLTNMKLNDNTKNRLSKENDPFKFPIFWCEVWDKFAKKWITIDPMNFHTIEQIKTVSKLEPDNHHNKRNIMRYVVAFDRKEGCKDITRRYVKNMYSYKIRHGKINGRNDDDGGEQWYEKVIKSLSKRKRMKIDDYEDIYFKERDEKEGMPTSLQDFKSHPVYVLEKDIKQTQLLSVNAKECGFLRLTGNRNSKTHNKVVKVYYRKDVIDLKTPRQWYQQGRILKAGARFKKIIKKPPNLRFNAEEGDEEDNEDRLYSIDDTELYIPQDANELGEIKKNTYGNIEIFTQSMIPHNCCLIENKYAIKAARFIRVEFAPAVTSFKFQGKKQVKGNVKPNITGVVVAEWFRDAVVAAIEGIEFSMEQDERHANELKALEDWNAMLLRLRIKSNLNETYGVARDDKVPEKNMAQFHEHSDDDDDIPAEAGGFFISQGESHLHDNEDQSLDIPEAGGFVIPHPEEPIYPEEETGSDVPEPGGFLPTVADSNDMVIDDGDQAVVDDDYQAGTDNDDQAGMDDEYEAFMDDLNES